MNFAALTADLHSLAASIFGANESGVQSCAWFPADLTANPATSAGYTRALGAVAVGAVKAKASPVAMGFERTETDVSVSLNAVTWRALFGAEEPRKSQTVFIIGPALEDGTPGAGCVQYMVAEEIRFSGGVMEIDARRCGAIETP